MASSGNDNQVSEIENRVNQLADDLACLSTNIQLFSLSVRSLYEEKCVSSSVEHGQQFITLRNETRDDALVYFKGVMPVNKFCIIKLQDFFEYYEKEYFEWDKILCNKILCDKLEMNVISYRQACDVLIKMHQDIMVALKQSELKAKVLAQKFENRNANYEKEVAALRAKSKSKSSWAVGLSLVPGVNLIASPLLFASAEDDKVNLTSKDEQTQQDIMFYATKVVSETLIPALTHFIEGLESVAGFFNSVQKELKILTSRDGKESKKELHYNMLKKRADEVKAACTAFHEVMPSVQTNFRVIPLNGSNKKYVDGWLEKERELIINNCMAMIAPDITHVIFKGD